MLRRRAILCVGLALLLCARGVRAGETPPPFIDPVEVAGLLLSPDDDERERGVGLLLARLDQGGDVGPFLRAMASAQALVAQGALGAEGLTRQTLLERTQAYRRRLVQAKGRTEAGAGVAETAVEDETEAPVEAPAQAAQAARPDVARAALSILRVPRAEYDAWRAAPQPTDAVDAASPATATIAGALTLGGDEAEAVVDAARRLPGATVTVAAAATSLGPDPRPVLRADRVTYRQGIRRTKGGAFALRSGEIDKGLRVLASAVEEQGGRLRVRIQVRYTDVPQPLPVTRIRPAADVEAIEVDSPEWRTASAELWHQAATGETITFVFADVVPDEVVLVGVDLAP